MNQLARVALIGACALIRTNKVKVISIIFASIYQVLIGQCISISMGIKLQVCIFFSNIMMIKKILIFATSNINFVFLLLILQ